MKPAEQEQALVRMRAELIVQVQSGLMSASEAAKRLGVSRKTYYKWEKRALQGMLDALSNRLSGRPSAWMHHEKEGRKRQSEQLKNKLRVLERKLKIREWHTQRGAIPRGKAGRLSKTEKKE